MPWQRLERELIDLLRQQGAPIDNIDGTPYIGDYDMNGQSYPRISIEELARELDARGIK